MYRQTHNGSRWPCFFAFELSKQRLLRTVVAKQVNVESVVVQPETRIVYSSFGFLIMLFDSASSRFKTSEYFTCRCSKISLISTSDDNQRLYSSICLNLLLSNSSVVLLSLFISALMSATLLSHSLFHFLQLLLEAVFLCNYFTVIDDCRMTEDSESVILSIQKLNHFFSVRPSFGGFV